MKNLFIIAALFISSLVNATEQNHYFTPNKNIVASGKTTVYFVAQNPEKYDWVKWDFGDGQMEYSINPAHEYNKVGIYNVKMIVSKGPKVDTFCKKAFVTILPSGNTTQAGDYALDADLSKENLKNLNTPDETDLSTDLDNSSINVLNKNGNSGTLEIRNLNGDILYQTTIFSSEIIKNIPIDMLKKGLYIVYITTDNKTTVKKIYKN